MPNLNSTIDLDLKAFLRWWRRELLGAIPKKIKQKFTEQQGVLTVSLIEGRLVLHYHGLDEHEELPAIPRTEAGIQQFKHLLQNREPLTKAKVRIRLTAGQALHRELMLPLAAKENLIQVLAYELDRYTPFRAEQVYFTVIPLPSSQEPGFFKARLIFTPRDMLDGLADDLQSLGLSADSADYALYPNADNDFGSSYNLLPEPLRRKAAATPLLHWGLVVAALGLTLTALVLPVVFEHQAVAALENEVHSIEKEAKKVKAQQQDIDAVIEETEKLLNEKRNRPMMVSMLNELSRLVKDDTWLAYLQYSDGHLQIQGESPTASSMIGILEASELFNNARFASPVTQNTTTKLERFQITVDVTSAGGRSESTDQTEKTD